MMLPQNIFAQRMGIPGGMPRPVGAPVMAMPNRFAGMQPGAPGMPAGVLPGVPPMMPPQRLGPPVMAGPAPIPGQPAPGMQPAPVQAPMQPPQNFLRQRLMGY